MRKEKLTMWHNLVSTVHQDMLSVKCEKGRQSHQQFQPQILIPLDGSTLVLCLSYIQLFWMWLNIFRYLFNPRLQGWHRTIYGMPYTNIIINSYEICTFFYEMHDFYEFLNSQNICICNNIVSFACSLQISTGLQRAGRGT